ncbi:MAG: DUF4232 domain-containing protein [Jatrophihabitantaceae bacterium]
MVLTRLAVAGAAVLLLAGCTQKSQAGSGAPASLPSSTAVSSAPATSAPPTSISNPISFSPPSSSASPRPTSSPSNVIEPGGCPTSALTIRALRGSGAAEHQFAFLQFTNSTGTSCSLTGYPGVQLLLAGKPLGQPAVRSGKPISRVQIAPGSSVSAGLIDDSSCNAPISDSVQVIPPNRTDKIVLKLALRGCLVHVDPVAAS